MDRNLCFGSCYVNSKWGWFWGVWDTMRNSTSTPPLLFGFVATKDLVENKYKELGHVRNSQVELTDEDSNLIYDRPVSFDDYAIDYIKNPFHLVFSNNIEKECDCYLQGKKKPIWSRCRIGNSKWFWGVWASLYHYLNGDDPIISGYELTSDEAIKLSIKSTGNMRSRGVSPAYALSYIRKLSLAKSNKRMSQSQDVTHLEFLFTSDFPYFWEVRKTWFKHRIIKRTKCYIFIDRYPYKENILKSDKQNGPVYSVRLPRINFERDGVIYSRTVGAYFINPEQKSIYEKIFSNNSKNINESYDPNGSTEMVQALDFLGLSIPFTEADLKRTFRLKAFEYHPDHGGSNQLFTRLQDAVELLSDLHYTKSDNK